MSRPDPLFYIGVDVGGSKIFTTLVDTSGKIMDSYFCLTPHQGTPEETVDTICNAIGKMVDKDNDTFSRVHAIGIGMAGVVDPGNGKVVATPHLNLDGYLFGPAVEERFGIPVVLGNDVNFGTLGEKWLGAARGVGNIVGMFVGTGIGGGVIIDGKLVRGSREVGGEIGHMVMEPGGSVCGCGNRGCLETLVSHTAIERKIFEAIDGGQPTVLTSLLDSGKKHVGYKTISQALATRDKVVTSVMVEASEILGYACLSIRHILDPDIIVLGGGFMEHFGEFVLPIVEKIVDSDAYPGVRPGCKLKLSELGKNAVVLGAVYQSLITFNQE